MHTDTIQEGRNVGRMVGKKKGKKEGREGGKRVRNKGILDRQGVNAE